MTGIVDCCARAASGHAAAAPPSSVTNARLFTRSPRRRARAASAGTVEAERLGGLEIDAPRNRNFWPAPPTGKLGGLATLAGHVPAQLPSWRYCVGPASTVADQARRLERVPAVRSTSAGIAVARREHALTEPDAELPKQGTGTDKKCVWPLVVAGQVRKGGVDLASAALRLGLRICKRIARDCCALIRLRSDPSSELGVVSGHR